MKFYKFRDCNLNIHLFLYEITTTKKNNLSTYLTTNGRLLNYRNFFIVQL